MIQTRPLYGEDASALTMLLQCEPDHNLFHLSALREYGLASGPNPGDGARGRTALAWGAFDGEKLRGAVVTMRGTGGAYHQPDDTAALDALGPMLENAALEGHLSLLSGHEQQLGPLLPLLKRVSQGHSDRCYFCTLLPGDLVVQAPVEGFATPRLATTADMERLIDFYQTGFYSLANLPTRTAWHSRLSEQLAFRTLFIVEDTEGRVASAALTSAEGGGTAMLGGVATLDRYRSRGLSATCVSALCGYLFARGTCNASLFYLKDNTPAARVYARLGFHDAGEWLLVPLGFGVHFGSLRGLG